MRYIFLLTLFVFSMPSYSEIKLEIENYGIFGAEVTGELDISVLPNGKLNMLENIHLLEETRNIPMKKGVQFGIRFIVTEGCDQNKDLIKVVVFPGEGIVNPKNGKRSKIAYLPATAECGRVNSLLFTFEEKWEMIPGLWSFSVRDQQEKLIEMNLLVVE